MKLKCTAHGRRVMILEGTGKWVHRTGDLSDCDSLNAKIGDEEITRDKPFPDMAFCIYHKSKTCDCQWQNVDPAQRLLYDIFANRS